MAQQEETSNLSIDSPMDGKGGSMSVHRTGHIKHTLTDRFYLGTCFWTVFCPSSAYFDWIILVMWQQLNAFNN